MHVYEIECSKGLLGLEFARPEWEQLLRQCPDARFYHDPRWHLALQRHVISSDIYYFLVRCERTLVAVVPLERIIRRIGPVTVRILRLPNHPVADLADIIVAPDHRAGRIIFAIKKFLENSFEKSWDYINLERFTERSLLRYALDREGIYWQAVGHSAFVERSEAQPNMSAQLSSKQMRNVRRHREKAKQEHGKVNIERLSKGSLNSFYDAFLQIESSGWKGRQGSSIAARPDAKAFYLELMDEFGTTGQAVLDILRFGVHPAAGDLGIRNSDGSLTLLKIGYNEAYNAFGPGAILLQELLAQEEGSSCEINLATNPDWCARWHFPTEQICHSIIFNVRPHARLIQFARGVIRRIRTVTRGQA